MLWNVNMKTRLCLSLCQDWFIPLETDIFLKIPLETDNISQDKSSLLKHNHIVYAPCVIY